MQILSLIQQLEKSDIRLWLEGEQLHFSAPEQGLSEELRQQIQQQKPAIIRFLQQAQSVVTAPLNKQNPWQYHPLSFAQQRIAFVQHLLPDSDVFHLQFAFELQGQLNTQRLESAINRLLQQHGILTTQYNIHGQRKINARPIQLNLQQTSNLIDTKKLQLLLRQENQAAFRLDQGEVFRHRLYQFTQEHHILLLTVHHIAIDYPSMQLLAQQLLLFYQQPEQKLKEEWAYCDYVVWQHAQNYDNELSYWQNQLAGIPALQLRQAGASLSPQADSLKFQINPQQTLILKQFATQQNTSLFNLLMAAYSVILHRFSQQELFAIGTTVSTRPRSEFEPLIGCFTNLLAIRCEHFEGSFYDHLQYIKATIVEALQHQNAPFEQVVRLLDVSNQHHTSPLFQAIFNWQESTAAISQRIDKLTIKPLHVEKLSSTYDLSLNMQEFNGVLQGEWLFRTAIYSAEFIQAIHDAFIQLLQGLPKQAEQPIRALSLLNETDRSKQLQQWNQTDLQRNELPFLQQYIEQQALDFPEHTAVIFEQQTLSYQQLNEQANQLAAYIQQHTSQTYVAVYCQRSLLLPVVLLAILKAGKAYLPIDEETPQQRITEILHDAGVDLLITQSPLTSHLESSCCEQLIIDQFQLDDKPSSLAETAIKEQPLFNLIYTSGSTGKPKGVLLSHQAIINRLLWMQETFDLQKHDKVLHKASIGFDVSVWEIFWPLMQGATLVLASPQAQKSAASIASLIRQHKIQFAHFVPSMLPFFIQQASDCYSLRAVIASGEVLHTHIANDFLQQLPFCQLYNLYGPTEAAIDVSFYRCFADDQNTPIGKPISNVQLYICDQHQQLLPIGAIGEIIIAGRCLAEGYLHEHESHHFIQHPFIAKHRAYRSGDLGYFDEEGNIHFVGRKDKQVKLRGYRIELNEVITHLGKHPDIKDCHVMIQNEAANNQLLLAYYISERKDLSSQALRYFLQKSLPSYMIPNHFVKVDTWPVNNNGKLAEHLLERWQLNAITKATAPRNDTEQVIYTIWSELLAVENFGIYEDFFSLGGHSLLASQALTQIEQHFTVSIPLVEIFNQATIANIAAVVRKQQEQKALIIDGPLEDGEQEFHL